MEIFFILLFDILLEIRNCNLEIKKAIFYPIPL